MLADSPPVLDFALLFDALPAPHVALAPDGTVLALNGAAAALLGHGAAQLPGQPLVALPAALAAAGHVLAQQAEWEAGLSAVQATASARVLRPTWAQSGPAGLAETVVRYWEATLQPVLAPAAAEGGPRELRSLLVRLVEVGEQLRTQHILDQLPVTITTLEGPELAFSYLSDMARQRMGPRAAVGRPVAECLPEVAAQGYVELMKTVRDTGRPYFGHEERTEMLDPATGQLREQFSNFGYLPLRGQRGAGVLAFGIDVTEQVHERRRNEALAEEARAADQRLRRVTESLPSITFISDQEGQVLYLSPQWYEYTGTSPADDLDAVWQAHMHLDDRARAGEAYTASLASGLPWRYELRLRRHDGAYRWFVSQGVPEPLAEAQAAGRSRQWFGSDLDIHELRETQQRLEAKDRQLTQILTLSPALIATTEGPEHRFTFTNPGYDVLVSHRARLGHTLADCFPELVDQGFLYVLDGVYHSGHTFVGRETPVMLQDLATGQEHWYFFDFNYQALRDGQGLTTGVLGFAVDVTEQVQARRAAEALQTEVKAADLRLRRQAEVLPIITFTTDAHGLTTYMSPQWYAFTGQPPGGPWAEVDTWWREVLHPEDQERAQVEIEQSISNARLGRVELRLRGANGKYRWFLTEAVVELDPNGHLERRYGFMLDVHELRSAQRRLEQKDRQLSQILSQSPAAIATMQGPEHRFAFTNPGYDALVGRRARLGQTAATCLPEMAEQGFIDLLDGVFYAGETFVGRETPIELQDPATGEWRESYLDFTYQPLRDEQDAVTGILAFVVDVSRQVRARREAEVLQAEMSRRDEQVRAITASVPVFIANYNPHGHLTYINPYYYEYTGLDPEGPSDAAWSPVPSEEQTGVHAVGQAAMAAGEPWQASFRVRRRDGELRWFQTKTQPYRDAAGQLAGFSSATVEIHDLHERTEELARSRADFAALADNIAQLAWLADARGHIFWYNQQWYDYTGYGLDEMQGQDWQKVHDPALVADVNERYLRCVQAGEPWEDTFPLRRHDGQYRWFLSRARPVRDEATGEVLRWCGTNTDVTELRQLERQLSGSEEELRIQAESIPQQVWTALPDGTADFYNHRTAAYFGEAMEKNDDANWLRFVHPNDVASVASRWESAIASQRYFEAEFRLRRYDGEYRWFLSQAQARRAPGGQVLKWYGTNTDIHQQRQLTEELGRREEQFRFLAESVPQIVWTSSGVGGNDYVNQRWFDFTGLEPAATGDRANWPAVIHPDDLNPTNQRWQHSVATGEFFEIEYRFRRHDGVYRWFLGQGRAQRNASGRVLKWFGTCTDIDDQKQAQQQLEDQNARLRRTNEDLDNFVYTASHDLKQPINNMAGIFEELTRTAYFRDPDAIKLISYFERALAQIFSTIDGLSAIVQGQRRQQEIAAEDVALAPLVADVLDSLHDQTARLHAVYDLDVATCPTVHFVRANLQSVLFNLFSNSLKYAAPDRPPRIRFSSAPDAVTGRPVLTVQDNGLGIDLERYGPQLFQLFRRFHPNVDGTGVGLYLVNRLVQNHGGRLEVASTVDEGTTFQIYL